MDNSGNCEGKGNNGNCGRVVIRCQHCQLVQFLRQSSKCIRCREWLVTPPEPVPIPAPPPSPIPSPLLADPLYWLPVVLYYQRLHSGISQYKASLRLGIVRQCIYKIEQGLITPKINSLIKYCGVLDISAEELFRLCEWMADGGDESGFKELQSAPANSSATRYKAPAGAQ